MSAKSQRDVSVEGGGHAPKLLHSKPYALTNAALPDHAQRVRSLFASDSPFAACGVGREAWEERRDASREAGGPMEAVVVQAARREGPTMEAEGRARAERTLNMDPMAVTLDVSRLSGWLNADARCRVKRESMGGGAACGQAGGRVGWGGRWRKQQGGPDCGGCGQGTHGSAPETSTACL